MRDDDRFDAGCDGSCPRVLRGVEAASLLVRQHPCPADRRAGRSRRDGGVIERDLLERAFRRISPEQRAIFVLHHYVGLTLPEVADELGVPLGTVKSRLHYATQALRAALDADARTAESTERLA